MGPIRKHPDRRSCLILTANASAGWQTQCFPDEWATQVASPNFLLSKSLHNIWHLEKILAIYDGFWPNTEKSRIGPALLGVYYPVLPSWGLCCGSSKNSPEGAPVKFLPLNFLSTRTHHIWPRFSLSAMCYEGILNVENLERQLEWLTHPENTESVSPLRHLQSRSGKTFCQDAFWLGPCDAFPYC